MIVGTYVGIATVGIFVYWYVFYDWSEYEHPLVSYDSLAHWGKCTEFKDFKPDFKPWVAHGGPDLSATPCDYFRAAGKKTASTMSLAVLVVIEMFNAMNAISEDGSLLSMPPWVNPYLLLAIVISMFTTYAIIYVPAFAAMFPLVPILGLSLWRADGIARTYALPLALAGLALAAWHSGLYAGLLPAPIVPCTENGPSCTGEAQMILGLPIPYLSAVAFAAILVCLLLPKGHRP